MRILFLTGALQPGCDGVGDYTRILAGELVRQGHEVTIISLYDPFIKIEINSTQYSNGVELPVLRLPSISPVKIRLDRANEWITKFNPEWISLQFVIYSFHPKGLPFNVIKIVLSLAKGRYLHIMFHELWIGMNIGASMIDIWLGWLQKRIIKTLISNLKPKVIQTQTRIYQTHISKLGFEVDYLPLFSNIPVVNLANTISVGDYNTFNSKQEISLVIFGSIHPGAPIEKFAKEASRYVKEKGREISLTIIGRCGGEQARWIDIWKSEGLTAVELGEQPALDVSHVFRNASVGISTTPIALVEKSGSVAAMLAHGLPVLCVSRLWKPRGIKKIDVPPGIINFNDEGLEKCLENPSVSPTIHTVSKVSKLFINTLLAAS